MRRARIVVAGLLALGMYPRLPVWGQNQEMEDRQRESEARRDALDRQIADQQREAESRREAADRQRENQERQQQREAESRRDAAERQRQDQERQQAERQREAESRRDAAERQRQDQERQQAERQREESRRDALDRQRQQAEQQREAEARRDAAERQRQDQERQQSERRREDARRDAMERQRQQAEERESEARRGVERLQQEQRERENEARRAAERLRQDREEAARRTVEAERLRRSQETDQRRDGERRQELQVLHQLEVQRQAQPLPRTQPPPSRGPAGDRPSGIRQAPPARNPETPPAIVVRPRAPEGALPPGRRDDSPGDSLYIGAPRQPGTPAVRARGRAYIPPPSSAVEAKTPDGGLRLNPTGSDAIRRQLNAARQELKGVNARPLPPGRITVRGNGGLLLNTDSASYDLRANGRIAGIRANSRDAQFGPDGRVRSLRTPNLDIRRDHRGKRIIIGRRPDKSTVVVTGRRRGYLERFFQWRNQQYIHRTWWWGGAAHSRYFRQYRYHGLYLPYYMSDYYYSRAFYGWASSPWGMRATFSWPWLTESWYRGYVRYFTPAVYYADAYTWLADYILAKTMEAGYSEEAGNADAAPLYEWGAGDDLLYAEYDTPITEDLRADVALEVRHHLDAERELAEGNDDPERVGLPAFLQPNRVLVVSQSLIASAGAQTCDLTHGDILRLREVPPDDATTAVLRVAASKRGDCPANLEVALPIEDLQDMLNDFRARLDDGLAELRSRQGEDGLPAAPRAALAPPRPALPDAPEPETGIEAMITEQQLLADQLEAEVVETAFPEQP